MSNAAARCASYLEHDDVGCQIIPHSRVEAQRAGPDRHEPRPGHAVAGSEQRDLVAECRKFVAEIGDDPLGAAIELGRHCLHQG